MVAEHYRAALRSGGPGARPDALRAIDLVGAAGLELDANVSLAFVMGNLAAQLSEAGV
jgi:predicted nucleic acid-binding protein